MGEIKKMMKWKKRVDKEEEQKRENDTQREENIYGIQNVRGTGARGLR